MTIAVGIAGWSAPALAGSEEAIALAHAYRAVLADPTNTAANMEYARLAEAAGQPRKALATYERVLLYEPENEAARSALLRIRREIQPDKTLVTLETGFGYESNPQLAPTLPDYYYGFGLFPPNDDTKEFVNLRISDERRLGDIRWRTEVNANAEFFNQTDILDTAYIGATTGPLLDFGSRITVHPFVGGGTSTMNSQFNHYFSEAVAGASFEGYLEGAYQQLTVKAGYRDYSDSFYTIGDGYYVDAIAKLTRPGVFTENDAFVVTPHVRWSDIDDPSGYYGDPFYDDDQPGRYLAYGVKLQYFNQVADWLTLGIGVGIQETDYTDDLYYMDAGRRDVLLSPMASIVFNKLFGAQSDLSIDYRHDSNQSNLDYYGYDNNVVTAKVITRF